MTPTNDHAGSCLKSWKTLSCSLIILAAIQSVTACAPLLIGTAMVTSVDLGTERRTLGRNIDDNLLELELRSAYRNDENLGSPVNISVTIINGIVLLTGEVHTDEQRQYAESVARGYEQTRNVVNELDLAGRSSLNSRANDTWITGKVKAVLLTADNVPSSSIKVVTERGKVYLMGLVTQEEAQAAVEAAQGVVGVTHIVKVFEYIKNEQPDQGEDSAEGS